MKSKSIFSILLLQFLFATFLQAQQKSFDQNNFLNSQSGLSDSWIFGINTGASFGVNSNENTLFRGNSIATKLFGRYYFGNFGLGVSGGIIPGSINNGAVNKFLLSRRFPTDAMISNAKPANSYLLFGPSVRFGKRVQFSAELNGGMFYNDAGGLIVSDQSGQKPLYRFDNGTENLFPGFSGNIHLAYPINPSTHFFINTDYLQTKSSIRLLDPQRGIDVATSQNRDVKLFTVGVGIIKSFGKTRDAGSGLATGRRKHIAGVKYENKTMREVVNDYPGDHIDGLNTPATYNPAGTRSMMNESCGPVTLTKTFSDGTTEVKTFSCTNDLAQYMRQTQGATFGEKVQQGLQAKNVIHRDVAARNFLAGRIRWSASTEENNGIVTNKSVSTKGNSGSGAASASYAATGRMMNNQRGNGIVTNFYVREPGSGLPTGRRKYDSKFKSITGNGGGLATGRRQYQPAFIEDASSNSINNYGEVKSNPLYSGHGNSGTNPLFESNKLTNNTSTNGKDKSNPLYSDNGNSGTNPLFEGSKLAENNGGEDGLSDVTVYLIDVASGGTLATTKTESDGSFFFANLPSGNYIVKIQGNVSAEKQYDVTVNKKSDWAGQILSANDRWSIELTTDTGSVETAMRAARIKSHSNSQNNRTTSESNSKNDETTIISNSDSANNIIRVKSHSNSQNNRTSNNNLAWSQFNKTMNVEIGDGNGDGVADIAVGKEIVDFSGSNTSSTALRPGTPIGGIIVKGGKNPGGSFRSVLTNGKGEFEFTDLDAGNYIFTTNLNYIINDETLVKVGSIDVSQNTQDVKPDLQNNENTTAPQNSQPNEQKKSVTNILKTNHDTPKNSISNVR